MAKIPHPPSSGLPATPSSTARRESGANGANGANGRHQYQRSANERHTGRLEPDLAEARRFLDRLDPSAGAFTFQTLDDAVIDGKKRGKRDLSKVFNTSLRDCQAELAALNREGAGAYVTVNQTDLKGRRRENLVRRRAVWCEADHGMPDNLPLPPSMVVETACDPDPASSSENAVSSGCGSCTRLTSRAGSGPPSARRRSSR
jgi:hypothetical protein